MKKVHFSPVASLLMSLSLALGILVGDVGSFKLLTSAHAQQSSCGGSVNIEDGTALSGITVRNVAVNGTVLEQAVIASGVQLVDATLSGATGAFYTNGVYVGGDEGEGTTGVYVGGDEGAGTTGVYVGGDEGSPCVNGVYVGGDEGAGTTGVYVGGVATEGTTGVYVGGVAVGGALTGDNIEVVNGVITGQNLLLSGAALDGGSIGGTSSSVTITPAN